MGADAGDNDKSPDIFDVFDREVAVKPPKFQTGTDVRTKTGSYRLITTLKPILEGDEVKWTYSFDGIYGKFHNEKELEFGAIRERNRDFKPGDKITINEQVYTVLAEEARASDNLFLTNAENNRIFHCEFTYSQARSMTGASARSETTSVASVTPANQPIVNIKSPRELATRLAETVIGQDDAVRVLAISGFEQLKRPAGTVKKNVIVIGPTGSGKTLLARELSNAIGVPFAESKLGGVSTEGYKGQNLSVVLEDLVSQKDKPNFDRSIVFLDELDKTAERDTDIKGFGRGVQRELIGWTESARVKLGTYSAKEIDTTQILFIGAGAFVGLEKIIAERVGDREYKIPVEQLYQQLITEDLVKFGLMPELIGRFPIITCLRQLTEEDMVTILRTGKGSPLKKEELLIKGVYEVTVQIDEGVYGIMAKAAANMGTGARGLQTVVQDLFTPLKFEIKDYTKNRTALHIDTQLATRLLEKRLTEKTVVNGQKKIGFNSA